MRFVVLAGALVLVAGCGGGSGGASGASPSSEAPPKPSPSESVVVDSTSAQLICDSLRLADAYEGGDAPSDAADAMSLRMEAHTDAMAEDAEPALRVIAVEHTDYEAAAEEMTVWCKEHTEPINETSPW